MATKKELSAQLTEKGIAHDPNATVAVLKNLLDSAAGANTVGAASDTVAPVPATQKEDPELQAAWDEFLVRAEADRRRDGTLHIFEAQKARGEFDTIPDSFRHSHGIRVAPK